MLQAVADLTSGRTIGDDPSAAFVHNLPSDTTTRPIWPWLLLVAALLLPLDIATRRLTITAYDMRRAWAAITGRVLPAQPAGERSAQVDRLFAAKERASTRRSASTQDASTQDAGAQDAVAQGAGAYNAGAQEQPTAPPTPPPPSPAPDTPQKAPGAAAPQPSEPEERAEKPAPPREEGETLASRLRKRRE